MFGIRQLQETLECDLDINTEHLPASSGQHQNSVNTGVAGNQASVSSVSGLLALNASRDALVAARKPAADATIHHRQHKTPAIFGSPSAPSAPNVGLFVIMTEPITCHSCHYPCSEPSLCCPAAMNAPLGKQKVQYVYLCIQQWR